MRKYYINNREVTKEEWSDFYQKNPEADVTIRTQQLPRLYIPPKTDTPITPERAREINKKTKQLLTSG